MKAGHPFVSAAAMGRVLLAPLERFAGWIGAGGVALASLGGIGFE
jgi:hypothetical protein